MNNPDDSPRKPTPELPGALPSASGSSSEVPTPRTSNLLMQMKLTPEYTKEKDTDRDRALNLCRQLERELLIVGVALDNQNERWGLYGSASQAALRDFKARNAAGLPNAKLTNRPSK